MTMGEPLKKTCFVICPIGEKNSNTRINSDYLLENIIEPTLKRNYNVFRSDHINDPGIISDQIIESLKDCDLVIADLRELNPNVFYELGIRHTINKPTIMMCDKTENLPFDINHNRIIHYSFNKNEVKGYRKKLKDSLTELELSPNKCRNLVSKHITYSELIKLTENDLFRRIYENTKELVRIHSKSKLFGLEQGAIDTPLDSEKRLREIEHEIFQLNIKRNELMSSNDPHLVPNINLIDSRIIELNLEHSKIKTIKNSAKNI